MATQKAAFSIPSLIALIAAIGIIFAHSGPIITLLAVVAIAFGALGFLLSLLPSVRGGIVSLFGIGAGLIGVLIAIAKLLHWIF